MYIDLLQANNGKRTRTKNKRLTGQARVEAREEATAEEATAEEATAEEATAEEAMAEEAREEEARDQAREEEAREARDPKKTHVSYLIICFIQCR